jgi:tRNA modification GTPase
MPHVAVITPPGRAAVATIRIAGMVVLEEPTPLWRAANGRPLTEQPTGRVCFGCWGDESPEEVVLCRIDSDVVEVHCHGGQAAVARIIDDLEARGCEVQSWQEFERAGRDQIESECREALTRATTMRTADILWQQCQGRLSKMFSELEQMPPEQARERAAELLRWAEFGIHLTRPWQVVLCGRPNVGKSSLINALVGYGRSIVYDQPGTTRDVVTAETALEGWPIEFSDTAGLRDEADELESAGIARAMERLMTADLRILLLDSSQPLTDDDDRLLADWPDALVVAHKSDLQTAWEDELPGAIRVSSLTGAGLDELTTMIVDRLIPAVPPPLTPLPVTHRQAEFLTRLV